MEDIGSLHELFRERCTSSDSGRISSAILCWEAAYGDNINNDKDDDSQPGLDDMSVVSSESFFEEAETTEIQTETDDAWNDGSCCSNGERRHTTFSMDSE